MKVNTFLMKLEKETDKQIVKNQIKINRFASKYKDARRCFYEDDESDDLYDLLFDISVEWGIPEDEVYYSYVQSKYTLDGEISDTFEEDFATHITLNETIKTKEK